MVSLPRQSRGGFRSRAHQRGLTAINGALTKIDRTMRTRRSDALRRRVSVGFRKRGGLTLRRALLIDSRKCQTFSAPGKAGSSPIMMRSTLVCRTETVLCASYSKFTIALANARPMTQAGTIGTKTVQADGQAPIKPAFGRASARSSCAPSQVPQGNT
jgi:hypothetical protein